MDIIFNRYIESSMSYCGQNACIWELTLNYDFSSLLSILNRQDVWGYTTIPMRQVIDGSIPEILEFYDELSQLHDKLIDIAWQTNSVQITRAWYKDIDHYKKLFKTGVHIFKDKAGFMMNPHLDNHHTVFQLIFNITDNESCTAFYDPKLGLDYGLDIEPYYVSPSDKNTGIMFFNNATALHGIKGINRDRYIVYATIDIR